MNLTIRNIPKEVISKLRLLAKEARRSLNSEILIRLEQSVSTVTVTSGAKDAEARQVKGLKALLDSWEDDRSTEEIIADIYGRRSPGREVNL